MKNCPNCGTRYTDDTLQFCLQDGGRLVLAGDTGSPTIEFREYDTSSDARRKTSQSRDWDESEITRVSSVNGKGSNSVFVVIAAALLMLVVLGVAGIGIWLYLNQDRENAGNTNSVDQAMNLDPGKTPGNTVSGTPAATQRPDANVASNYPAVDADEIRREVSKKITYWKTSSESLDLDSHMSNYADTVDYYNRRNASRAYVRSDRQRAFTQFDSISIDITNISVSADAAGDVATAVFDKEWVFDGARRSTGKVRSQLRLRRINGEWLITGERDVKVYYVH
jgi:hypothetical protein